MDPLLHPDDEPLTLYERVLIGMDAVLGVALCTLAGFGFEYVLTTESPEFEVEFGVVLLGLIAAMALPSGLLFGLAGVAVWRRWPSRSALHGLALLAPFVVCGLLALTL